MTREQLLEGIRAMRPNWVLNRGALRCNGRYNEYDNLMCPVEVVSGLSIWRKYEPSTEDIAAGHLTRWKVVNAADPSSSWGGRTTETAKLREDMLEAAGLKEEQE